MEEGCNNEKGEQCDVIKEGRKRVIRGEKRKARKAIKEQRKK